MSKIPDELNNPYDNLMMKLCEMSCPLFKSLNFTPNMLTSLSLFFGLGSVYLFTTNNYTISSLLFIISYFFDCIDGYYARKYKMVTKFGDYFDHTKDIIVTALIVYFLIDKYLGLNDWNKYLPFFLILFLPCIAIQISCIEVLNSTENSNFISDSFAITKKICPVNSKKDIYWLMKYIRFCSSASAVLYISGLIFYTQFLNV